MAKKSLSTPAPGLEGENEGNHANTATRSIERSALEVAQRRISAPYRSFGAPGAKTNATLNVGGTLDVGTFFFSLRAETLARC